MQPKRPGIWEEAAHLPERPRRSGSRTIEGAMETSGYRRAGAGLKTATWVTARCSASRTIIHSTNRRILPEDGVGCPDANATPG